MSSNNCKQSMPDEQHWDELMTENTENREKKVCFICGSHTTLIINIHEPRCGPNMIDVISEKFKMRPLHDDKFLCYSCNNWLINWYTVQKKNDDSSHEDAHQQTTSSTMSAAITPNAHEQTATKTSDDRRHCTDANELIIVSDDEEVDENVDVNNVIQTLRDRLKKYLYYPNKQKGNDLYDLNAHSPATVIELNGSPDMHRNCERCGNLIRKQSNRIMRRQRTFCRNCRFSMRRNGKLSKRLKMSTNHLTRSSFQQRSHHSTSPSSSVSTFKRCDTTSNRNNIFKKLQQLGTSIYYESNECREKQHELNQHMTSIPHEMDMSTHKSAPANSWKQPTANESNEILMTFNTVVTEVFPIEQLYNYYDQQNDQMPNSTNDFNIQEILRNVPKSLTITIA